MLLRVTHFIGHIVELQRLEHLLPCENMFEIGKFELMSVYQSAKPGGIIGIALFIFSNMKVCCVFSLESPHQGDSNEYTKHTFINIKGKHPKLS